MRSLWRRIQRQATVLVAALIVIFNLVVLSGVLHLSDRALGVLNAVIAAVLVAVVAVVALGETFWVRRAYSRRARERPEELVPTAGGMSGGVIGRDDLCEVMIEDLFARRLRRVHVIVGGVGTGKTALLVRLTQLLAERRVVPVPVRMRDAQEYVDFRELARTRFIADAQAALVSDADVDTVWRQLCRDGKIVVLADGLEEALTGGVTEREHLIRLAIRQANKQRLPLVIASRPDDSLRSVDATFVELAPLSEDDALAYAEIPDAAGDDGSLGWIVTTADVAEAPLYLQITCELLQRFGLASRTPMRAPAEEGDQIAVRLGLLEAWVQVLIAGPLLPGVPLTRHDRAATVEQLSLLACIGLRLGRLEVSFDDFEAMRASPPSGIITQVEARLSGLKRRLDFWLAADWGESLGLVEEFGNGVRFRDSIVQAYLGSRLIEFAVADEQYRFEALRKSGPEFLLALVMCSRAGLQQARPAATAGIPVRATVPRAFGADAVTSLCEEASGRSDVKVLDLYAAALQIDAVQNDPAHEAIAGKLAGSWPDVWARDHRTLEEAKLGLVRRFGEAARTISARRRMNPPCPAEPAYLDLYDITCSEPSYPIRLRGVQEIGAGGDDAFVSLQGVLSPPSGARDDERIAARAGTPGSRDKAARPPVGYHSREQEKEQDDRAWRETIVRAWLAPLLAVSAREKSPEARQNLEQWVEYVGEHEASGGTAVVTLPVDTQILVTREFGASRDLVYQAWTTPELIKRWISGRWGKITIAETDPRVGGRWRYVMMADDGAEITVRGEYREIVPNERIVSVGINEDTPEAEAVATVTFSEKGGHTILTLLLEHASQRDRDLRINSGLNERLQKAMDELEQVAGSLRPVTRDAGLRLSLEVALAQGFKHAANQRPGHPHVHPEAHAYLTERALELLKRTHFWYSRQTLIQALCLFAMASERARPPADQPHADYRAIVLYWTAFPDSRPERVLLQTEHPFVAEAAELAVLALETGQPERFVWIDESSAAARIGSGASPGVLGKHNLWIPPSTGWAALHPRAQRLLADVLLLLNLAERGERLSDRARCLRRTHHRDELPPCLWRHRSALDPTRTVGMAQASQPGTNCVNGCPFDLCPYPPKGELSNRVELSEAFARRQQAPIIGASIWHRAAPWQFIRSRDLKRFWKQMESRAVEYRPGQF